jgi:hypothetical protein
MINGAEFNLQGHDYGMDGAVKFLYEDLTVTVLEKDKGVKELDKKSLLTFLANIAIKNSNPKRTRMFVLRRYTWTATLIIRSFIYHGKLFSRG